MTFAEGTLTIFSLFAPGKNSGVDRIQSTSSSPTPTAGPVGNDDEPGAAAGSSTQCTQGVLTATEIDDGPEEIAVEA